jgi:hypothetical protein
LNGSKSTSTHFVFDKDKKSELAYYGLGGTPLFACQVDKRFSYCLYVPTSYPDMPDHIWPLAVIVHGTDRPAQKYRDAFADFAEEHKCIILSPLFPAGISAPWELNSYKFIKSGDIRFDHVLLAMVDEVASAYRIHSERFLIHGFSGGGHFSHRFLYLHPKRMLGVSIGAPGIVTLLDEDHDWWVGVRNLEAIFGVAPDFEAMRDVQVHMVVGGDDCDTWEITVTPESRLWMPGCDLAGANRQDRMRSLKKSFEDHGISVRHSVVPGLAHEGFKLLDPVKQFFADVIADRFPAR